MNMNQTSSCFQLKANFLPCTTLQLTRYDWQAFEQQLREVIQKAPSFFNDLPILIDLDKIKTLGRLDFQKVKNILASHQLHLIGVRGGSEEQHQDAIQQGLLILPASKRRSEEDTPVKKEEQTPSPSQQTKIINTPIRSGVQIYAKDSDLTVTASVSPGAELLADGNIHVYGALRGRVLAGVQGNTEARIFCRTLEAELVSIAGYYLTKDDMIHSSSPDSTHSGNSGNEMKQIYLDGEQVRIEVL